MNDKYFIDTNIFVYCFDTSQLRKQTRSLVIVTDALQTGNGIISWQVVQEFLNVSTRRFSVPLRLDDAKVYLHKVLSPLCQVFPDQDLYLNALEIGQKQGFSFYDSLIVAGALRSECKILYSEDLQHGQWVNGVKIINPFI
jgi:predicted nucleic acid-binding protein